MADNAVERDQRKEERKKRERNRDIAELEPETRTTEEGEITTEEFNIEELENGVDGVDFEDEELPQRQKPQTSLDIVLGG
jgi:hypothetical protein